MSSRYFAHFVSKGAAVQPSLLGGAQVFTPTIVSSQSVEPGLLGGAQTFAPRVNQQVQPALLGGAIIFAPTITQTAPSIQPTLLGGAVVFGPTINQQVRVGLLGGAAIFAPRVNQQVRPALLGGAQTFAPTIISDQFIQVPLLGGAVVFAPQINQAGQVSLLGGALIFGPTVIQFREFGTVLEAYIVGLAPSFIGSFGIDAYLIGGIGQHSRVVDHFGTQLDQVITSTETLGPFPAGTTLDVLLDYLYDIATTVGAPPQGRFGVSAYVAPYFRLEAVIRGAPSASFGIDARIAYGATFSIAAWLRKVQGGFFGINAYIVGA